MSETPWFFFSALWGPPPKFRGCIFTPKFTQGALRDRLMSRSKNCLPTVSRQFLTRNYPRPNCLLKCLLNCLSPTREGFLSSFKINPAVRAIARQVRDKNCFGAIFAPRHQSVSSGPLNLEGLLGSQGTCLHPKLFLNGLCNDFLSNVALETVFCPSVVALSERNTWKERKKQTNKRLGGARKSKQQGNPPKARIVVGSGKYPRKSPEGGALFVGFMVCNISPKHILISIM